MTDPQRPEATPGDTPDRAELAAAENAALLEAIEEAEAEGLEPGPEAFADVEAEAEAGRRQAALVEAAEAAAASSRKKRDKRASVRPASVATTVPAEQLPYVDDRFSKYWVAAIIVTFVAIVGYGIFLGQGGILTPLPSPTPTLATAPSASPSPSPTANPSASGPSTGPSTSPSAAPTAAPTPNPSPPPSPPGSSSPSPGST